MPPSSEFHAVLITPTQPYRHTGRRGFVMQQIALSYITPAAMPDLRATTVVTLRTASSGGAITVCTLNDSCRQWCIELELGAEDKPVLAVTGHDVDVVGALLPPAVPEDPGPTAAASDGGDSDDDSEEGGEEMGVDESGEEGEEGDEAGEEDEDEEMDEDEDEGEDESDESVKVDESEEGGKGDEGDEDDEEDESEESDEADEADEADAVAEVDEVAGSESDDSEGDEGEGESDEEESDEEESDEEDEHSAPVVAAAPAKAAVHPRVEAAPSEAEGGAEGDLVDMDVNCRDCRADFVFTVQEQRFFMEHGYTIPRVRCKQCSEAKKLGNYDKSGQGATPGKGKGKGDGDKGKGKGKGKGKEYSGFAPDSGGKGKGKGKDSGKGKGGSATDTRPCYNCGEAGHQSWTCSKPRSGKGKGASGGKGAGGKGGGGW
eukprot:scaffold126854_cov57-Phaeocystis_antarctica.AAC.4